MTLFIFLGLLYRRLGIRVACAMTLFIVCWEEQDCWDVWASVGVWECGRRVRSQIDGQRQLDELQHVVEGLHVVAELGDQIDQFERLVGLLLVLTLV